MNQIMAITVFDGIKNAMDQIIGWLPALLRGAGITVSLTAISVFVGLILGLFVALGKISKNKVINKITGAYIFFFRGTPLLMQLYFIYYALPLVHEIFTIENQFIAAFIAFSLNSAAYQAEVIRAAIQSIDKGQMEAARALGMTYGQAMKLVIVPQSYRRLIPPVGNEFIMVLKDTALVSVISLTDLMRRTSQIQTSNGSPLVYIPAAIIYLIMTALFTYIFSKLEKKYSKYE